MRSIESSRLKVGYELPGAAYRNTRFDWSSLIVSIELDGGRRFASSEYEVCDDRYLDGGRGLVCEFGIHAPVGYDDCDVGDWFPKPGVGFLRRESAGDYDFFHRYREVRGQLWELDESSDAVVRMTGSCAPYRGYGWRLTRTWKVSGTVLECASRLENIGTQPIETDEYCHNFLRLGDAQVGPDYRIDFSFPLPQDAPEVSDPSSCLAGAFPEFVRVPATDFYLGGLMLNSEENPSWRARDIRTGFSMSERLVGAGLRCALWGRAHVISPELFIRIAVKPGGSQEWARSWTFG
jgi:hypothetical protein